MHQLAHILRLRIADLIAAVGGFGVLLVFGTLSEAQIQPATPSSGAMPQPYKMQPLDTLPGQANRNPSRSSQAVKDDQQPPPNRATQADGFTPQAVNPQLSTTTAAVSPQAFAPGFFGDFLNTGGSTLLAPGAVLANPTSDPHWTPLALGLTAGNGEPYFRSVDIAPNAQFGLTGNSLAYVAAAQSGTFIDLGSLGGISNGFPPIFTTFAYGVNDSGHVVGGSLLADNLTEHAFVYFRGKMHDLGTLGGRFSQATAVNKKGEIVGWAQTQKLDENGDEITHAFLYSGGRMRDLGSLGGTYCVATGLNNHGEVAGWSDRPDGSTHAFVYSHGVMKDIGTLGGSKSFATAMNDSGLVVGFSYLGDNKTQHAFLYSRGKMIDLGTLGGGFSQANALNQHGDIVGGSETGMLDLFGEKIVHAFLYSNGQMHDLGTLSRFYNGYGMAYGINDNGVVVGWVGDNFNSDTAFVYSNGQMTELTPFFGSNPFFNGRATGVNNSGQIVGYATSTSFVDSSFIYTPNN